MLQRFVTGAFLIVLLSVVLALGGWVFAVVAMAAICIAMYEEFHALAMKGHRPVQWPTWLGMAASIPMVLVMSRAAIVILLIVIFLINVICVVFRKDPKLEDILVSVMPLFTVLLPGMCLVSLLGVEPRALQVTFLCLVFVVAVMGDTMAFLVGSRVGGPKLCPQVSPHKTVAGALGGLLGSVLGALAVGGIAALCAPYALAELPGFWHYVIIGLFGGVAGQMGDLFASLVKRHCGIKDFSNLFPGHGGMLDRMDSILFTSVVVFCFHVLTLV